MVVVGIHSSGCRWHVLGRKDSLHELFLPDRHTQGALHTLVWKLFVVVVVLCPPTDSPTPPLPSCQRSFILRQAVLPGGTAGTAAAMPAMGASAEAPSAAPAAAPGARALGLPPSGPVQAAVLAMQPQSAAGSQAPALDLSHNEEVEATLASPIVATPPALLRPGVGAAARGAAARGRGLLQRNSTSGSFVSSR